MPGPFDRIDNEKGSPDATSPDKMLKVDVPEGTNRQVDGTKDGIIQAAFGVSSMRLGLIRRASGERVEGTNLHFDTDRLSVDVGRRDLSGDEINQIAGLVRDLNDLSIPIEVLPNQIIVAEEVVRRWTSLKSRFRSGPEETFDVAGALANIGLDVGKMRSSHENVRQEWRKKVLQLATLDVIRADVYSGADGQSLPIEEMSQRYATEANQKMGNTE